MPWTNQRLNRLFERYNRIYWDGRIPSYSVLIRNLADGDQGQCNKSQREIEIDVKQHKNDREVRSTLLHEMAHAAAKRLGHGREFFAEIENLLRKNAPMTVGPTEAHYANFFHNVVPPEFPLARKAMARAEAARERAVKLKIRNAEQQGTLGPGFRVDEEYLLRRFEEAAINSLSWEEALFWIGGDEGLIDDMNRPLGDFEARVLKKARRIHEKTRRKLE